jgi:aldose 1-epimerase
MKVCSAILLALLSVLVFANGLGAKDKERALQVSEFGKTKDGAAIQRYVLSNKKNFEVVVTNYGASLVSVKAPDRSGKIADVVFGYDDLDGYEQDKAYIGATVGRYANRIANGALVLDGSTYHIPKNNGPNALHGGLRGFNKKVWTGVDRSTAMAQVVEFSYTSVDGEEGFPGTLKVTVTYTVPAYKNEVRIDYSATTDKDTVLNLTNHSYFNLSGVPTQEILNHEVSIRAEMFTPVNATQIPTGEMRPVADTPFDFRKSTAIGARINGANEQLKIGGGYDVNWVLDKKGKPQILQLAAEAYEPSSGRVLSVETTEPGLQLYTGNSLDGTARGKGGVMYARRTAFCFETQHYADSPNHPNFPTTKLKPGQTFRSTTIYRFSTR